jgi:hypothetical protein
MLADREVDPLDERGVDLPTVRGQNLCDAIEGAKDHAMVHFDHASTSSLLDYLCIEQLG